VLRGHIGRLGRLILPVAVLAACTGSPVKPDPANAPNSVVASLDRIRQGQTRLGGPTSCLDGEYCAAGLSRVYGINLGAGGLGIDTSSAVAEALAAGAIDVGALPAGSVETADARLEVLRDDRLLQPADNVIPVAGPAIGAVAGPLATAVDRISAALDQDSLTTLQRALAAGLSPEVAARAWLTRTTGLGLAGPPPGAPAVVIGARPDATSQALSELYAGALDRAGWAATIVPVGDRRAEVDALAAGALGLAPDTTSDLLEALVGFTGTATWDAQRDVVLLRAALADLGLVAFEPAPASPGVVFAVARAVASALGLSTLSDLARVSGAPPVAPVAPPPLTPADVASDTEGPLPPAPPTLGIGSAGTAVAMVQARLVQLGYLHGAASATGAFDEPTRRAVAAFQADQGLLADGAVDLATLRALLAARPGARTSAPPLPGDPDSVRLPPTVTGGPSVLYLVFAGGPTAVTSQVLDVLDRHGATATFFVDADAVAANPDTLRRIQAAGDAVGVTTGPHNTASAVAEDVLFRTVASGQEAVAAVDGRTPSCLLPPYGATTPAVRARASQLGLHTVLWDVDPQDWRRPGAAAISADVADSIHPGSVILLHDGGWDRSQTVTALDALLSRLGSLGYRFAAIPGC
jgi:peptidoglycan-N-acetylglucosamine deacetylase